MDLRGELLKIRDDYGVLTPDLVVEAAKPENHPLHSYFDWDDKIAGPKWRREQARQLIKSVKVRYLDTSDDQDRVLGRAFLAVPQGDNVYHWEPVEEVVRDPLAYKLVLKEMERELEELRKRYGHLQEYAEALRNQLQQIAAD